MKIIAFSDIHGRIDPFIDQFRRLDDEMSSADLVVLAGDITNFGREKEAAQIIETIESLNKNILAVSGNCDYPEVSTYLTNRGIDLECDATIQDGFGIVGAGGSLPCPGKTPNEYDENELELCLAAAVERLGIGQSDGGRLKVARPDAELLQGQQPNSKYHKGGRANVQRQEGDMPASGHAANHLPFILVAHQPPVDTVADQVNDGQHVGSYSVRAFIEQRGPIICITGHIHEGRGTDTIGKTTIINPGPFAHGWYAAIDVYEENVEVDIKNARE